MTARRFGLAVVCAWAALGLTAWAVTPVTPAKKKAPAKKAAPKTSTTAKKAPAKGTPARTTTAASKRGAKKAPAKPAVTWRNRQLSPTQDRYREIQGALAAKGYLSADEASGAWGPPSVEALKKFQADQNIESSGKINSLSLIALGLGPKRELAPVKPAIPAQAQTPDTAQGH